MSVSNKKFFGLIAAALMVGAVAGCGGGGSNPTVIDDNVTINGGILSSPGASTESISAGANRTVTLTVNGTTWNNVAVAPTTSDVPANAPLAFFPANVPIIGNMTLGAAVTRDPGQLIINGTVVEGVTVDSNGRLSQPIVFAPSEYTTTGRYLVDFDGPWNIRAGNRELTVGQFTIGFQVNDAGATSFPRTITGKLPSNGGTTLDEQSFVTFTVDPAYANSTARLTVEKSNGDISKRIEVSGTSGTFSDLFAGGGNANIPGAGVDRVFFEYNPAN